MKSVLRRLLTQRHLHTQPARFASIQPPQSLTKRIFPPPIILRDACKCSRCVDQSTKQREFSFADIPPTIQASHHQDVNGNLTVKWQNDIQGYEDHVSTFTPAELDNITRSTPHHTPVTKLWDDNTFCRETSPVTYDDFMNTDAGLAKVLLLFRRHGLVFITGVPVDEESVSKLATRIGPLRNTFYGNTWDVRSVPQAKNVAYTSKYLGFHMDLLYMRESPTAQFLHCLENTCTGGESRFVDTLKAFDILAHEHPEYVNRLQAMTIQYEYDNDGQYFTHTKPVAKVHGVVLHRRPLEGAVSPVLERTDRIYWSPPFIGSAAKDVHNGPKAAKDFEAARVLAGLFERDDLVYETKMEAGTCVIFDNLRVLHARNAFDVNSGKRWLRGCYLDGQDVLSRERSVQDDISRLAAEF